MEKDKWIWVLYLGIGFVFGFLYFSYFSYIPESIGILEDSVRLQSETQVSYPIYRDYESFELIEYNLSGSSSFSFYFSSNISEFIRFFKSSEESNCFGKGERNYIGSCNMSVVGFVLVNHHKYPIDINITIKSKNILRYEKRVPLEKYNSTWIELNRKDCRNYCSFFGDIDFTSFEIDESNRYYNCYCRNSNNIVTDLLIYP